MKNRFIIALALLIALAGIFRFAHGQTTTTTLTTGSKPHSVVINDIDEDGKRDILSHTGVYYDSINDNAIQMLMNTGMGFTPLVLNYPPHISGNTTRYIAVGDCDHNGKKDIVFNWHDCLGFFSQDAFGNFTFSTVYVGKIVGRPSVNANGVVVFSTSDPTCIGLYEHNSPIVFLPSVTSAYADVEFINENEFMAKSTTDMVRYFINTSTKTVDSTWKYSGVKNFCFNSAGEMITSMHTTGGMIFSDNDTIPDGIFSFLFVPDAIKCGYMNGTESIISMKGNFLEMNGIIDTLSNYNLTFVNSQMLEVGDVTGDGDDDIACVVFNPLPPLLKGIVLKHSAWGFTSAESHEQISGISVFPNPATDYITIEGLEHGTEIKLYDMLGKLVLSSTNDKLDIRALPVGKYIIRIGEVRKKLIKIS